MKTSNTPKDAALREALRRLDEEMVCPKGGVGLSFRKIAAVFLAAAFLGGLAWAISPLLTSPRGEAPQPAQESASSLTRRAESGAVLFSDIRLDSILSVVSAHYGKAVCFHDTAAQALRMSTVWDSEDSLAVFIATLNEFDGLTLKDERDTVYVELNTGEEE